MAKVHHKPSYRKTIILIGRDGNGKSSIGNAILGENFFTTTWSSEKNLDVKIRSNDEFIIFDSNGIGDTGEDMNGNMVSVVNNARNEIVDKLEQNSLKAIVFVLKYGTRFTKQEKDAVTMVKSIFGEHVFRDFVIIAFSYGDLFENDNKDDGYSTSFDQWCRKQTGDIKDLFEEVDYRCILFNKHATTHSVSINQLRRYMDSLPTTRAMPLQVYDFEEKTYYGSINKANVEANRRSCSECLESCHHWLFFWLRSPTNTTEVITQDVTSRKENVRVDQRSCCECCQSCPKMPECFNQCAARNTYNCCECPPTDCCVISVCCPGRGNYSRP